MAIEEAAQVAKKIANDYSSCQDEIHGRIAANAIAREIRALATRKRKRT